MTPLVLASDRIGGSILIALCTLGPLLAWGLVDACRSANRRHDEETQRKAEALAAVIKQVQSAPYTEPLKFDNVPGLIDHTVRTGRLELVRDEVLAQVVPFPREGA